MAEKISRVDELVVELLKEIAKNDLPVTMIFQYTQEPSEHPFIVVADTDRECHDDERWEDIQRNGLPTSDGFFLEYQVSDGVPGERGSSIDEHRFMNALKRVE